LRQAIITSKSTTAIALANIVIIVANESTDILKCEKHTVPLRNAKDEALATTSG
jgi:hypothetical protein